MSRVSAHVGGTVAVLLAVAAHSQSPPPVIGTTSPLPSATRSAAYAATLYATGGTRPYTWGVSAGAPELTDPATVGLDLDPATGVLSGIVPASVPVDSPRRFGFFVSDANGLRSALTHLTLKINPEPVAIKGSPPAGLMQLVPFEVALSVAGGTAPYTWSIAAGSLPDGVQLHSKAGLLHGVPADRGVFRFTLQARDANNAVITRPFELFISHSPTPSGGHRR